MGVSHVSSGMSAFMGYWQSQIQQGRQDFRQLSTALKSGDLTAAQQAFTDLQQVTPGFGPADTLAAAADATAATTNGATANSAAPTGKSVDPRQVIKTDVAALGTALQSGDLEGAKTAFATLQQDMMALQRGHHHHHHHERGDKTSSGVATSAPAQGPISTTPPATAAASVVKDADGDHDGTKTFYGIDLKA